MISLPDLYKKLTKIGLNPRAIKNAIEGAISISSIKYWAYQDFTITNQNSVTLTENQNTSVPLPPVSILNGTAVLSTTDGKPVGIFLARKTVASHTNTAVTFNASFSGDIRVWWLQMGTPPAGIEIAPKFIRASIASYLDSEYVNQQGDETISGVKTFTSVPKAANAPVDNDDLVNKQYADALTGAGFKWIDYTTGYNVEPVAVATTLPGEVYQYTYLPGVTYYRYIANNGSEDAFYTSFVDPTLTGQIAKKKLTI